MFDKPVVKWKGGRYGNNWWFKYSPKVKRNVDMYSDLEYDNWILIENDLIIRTFTEQPHRVQEWLKGEYIDTIFDMWCVPQHEKGYFMEVKYEHELDPRNPQYNERSAEQVAKQQKWCEYHGYKYIIRTDRIIRENKILLNNYKEIIPYIDDRRIPVDTDRHRILDCIGEQSITTLGQIYEINNEIPKQRIRSELFNLIYEGKVAASIDKIRICSELEVWKT
ncbi:hypothetical protein GC102_25160 [Paenibacillus sp. LMG 31460]|uniref:TnsA endonuclease N-terminal domain-containing protein n=1 Tax=Paenibacillus germinis TaxID=2654979 RepID=A0ABX1Z6L0_9BACL|nr:hypothetical protein [Paenibacillus germinis]NOU89012.1 hypothetical protein [Paenibacillus germinis]